MANKSFFSALVASRQRQANNYVNSYLLTLDDEALKRHGYNRKDIAAKRTGFSAGL